MEFVVRRDIFLRELQLFQGIVEKKHHSDSGERAVGDSERRSEVSRHRSRSRVTQQVRCVSRQRAGR